jgi:hypothetical protein
MDDLNATVIGQPTATQVRNEMPDYSSNESLPITTEKLVQRTSLDVRAEFDRRIAAAPANELPSLIRARGEIIQQNEWQLNGAHQRRGQMGLFYAKIGFSAAAAIGGAGLIVSGFLLPGYFLLGGAVFVFVPDYVTRVVNKLRSDDVDAL